VTNPNTTSVLVRLTTFGSKGVLARSTFEVPPSTQVQRSVPAGEPGAATEVEYFGGWVGAGTVVRTHSSPPSSAASRCAASPSRRGFVTDANTASGATAYLIVMNPFAQAATFDVTIRTDKRPPVRPGSLSPLVLPARSSTAVKLDDFVLQAPTERLVTADVSVTVGRAVAGGLVVSGSGVRAEVAQSDPATRWVLPAGKYSGTSTITVVNASSRRADLEVVAQGASSQKALPGVSNVSVGAGSVRAIDVEPSSVGLVLRSTNGVPVVAARRLTGTGGDVATEAGANRAGTGWMILPSESPSGGKSFLVLENPGDRTAHVALRFLGRSGPIQARGVDRVDVPAGRTIVVDLSVSTGKKPISVVVTAAGESVVAASASYPGGGAGYTATLGEPIPRAR